MIIKSALLWFMLNQWIKNSIFKRASVIKILSERTLFLKIINGEFQSDERI